MPEKNKNQVALTGGVAAAEVMRQAGAEVVAAYPITPQTPIIETFAKFKADGRTDAEIVMAESEHSAMGACVGGSAAGARTFTATSSQGLALMHEVLYIASGLRLPITMFVSARALSAPINIHNDHSDVMGSRDCGWIQVFCESVQEVYDFGIIGLKLAEISKLPAMVIMDGFITSHSTENLSVLDDSEVSKFVGVYKAEEHLFDFKDPKTFGVLSLPDSFFEFKIDQEEAMEKSLEKYKKVCADFSEISGRIYNPFEEYCLPDADYALVTLGSVAGTAKEVIDKLRARGKKVGMLKINLWRPFPREEIEKALAKAKKVAVLEKSLSSGTVPPVAGEMMLSLGKDKVSSYVCGLGGREVFAKDIEGIFNDSVSNKKSDYQKINYIGNKK